MWLARGRPDAPYNVFDFQTSRKHGTPNRDGPADFLKDFKGYVTMDADGGNDGVYLGASDRIIASCCHAHERRKFDAAKGNDPKRAAEALSFYRQLFDIEDEAAEFTNEDRLAYRQGKSAPLLASFKGWLDDVLRGSTTSCVARPAAVPTLNPYCRMPGPKPIRKKCEPTANKNPSPEPPKPKLAELAEHSDEN
jgi:hypothetical protein